MIEEASLETVSPEQGPDDGPLLRVEGLKTAFSVEGGIVRAVDGVSFDVNRGEVFSIVGESGSGKSVTALSILGLIQAPAGRITDGRILYRGEDLVTMAKERRRQIRGDRIAMVFQDALAALNPVHRVGPQIAEVIRVHRKVSKDTAMNRAVELLETVGIPNARDRARDYPHQFSGGMRQRAMIAMAIALDPDLLIADEPTTALDVTVQAQIIEVLLDVRERFGTAIILITHDLGVVAEVADRVMVMYGGRKVEEADIETIFTQPKHPYTWGLLKSTTRTDRPRDERLYQIPGAPPSMIRPPEGCRFSPRCQYAQDICHTDYPDARPVDVNHVAACHFAQEAGWGADMAVEEAAAIETDVIVEAGKAPRRRRAK